MPQFDDLKDLFNDVGNHRCRPNEFTSVDDPAMRMIGWNCMNCGERWEITVLQTKNSGPPWLDQVRKRAGRERMAVVLTARGCLIIDDEDEVEILGA